jgi:serine/threonine protein kinase
MVPKAMNLSREVLGNYELLAKIGEGGGGTVYKGRNRQTGEVVAVKTLPPNLAENAIFRKRLEQEFRATRQLDHPHIVRALDYVETESVPFLVMEFVEGESLGDRLERDGRLPEAEALRLIAQVCAGLDEAHRHGLVHRDVKPDNILVSPEGQAKLIDLGLVKETEADLGLTRTEGGLGTPHFMAPEQFRNAKNADARCDIYSLGATLYMMVTGELPFASSRGPIDAWMKKVKNELPAPRKLVAGLSRKTDRAIRRAMSADRDQRPASCTEFLNDLLGPAEETAASAPAADRRTAPADSGNKAVGPEVKTAPAVTPRAAARHQPAAQAAAEIEPGTNRLVEGLTLLGTLVVALAAAVVAGQFLFHR